MASQSLITVSPDGKYVAAQVHQYLQVVNQSTGAAVSLPSPVFSHVADNGEDAEGEGEEDGDDQEDADADDKQSAAKKAKTAAAAGKDKSGKGQRSHEGPKPIRVMAFHPSVDAPFFMYNTDEKYIHLYHRHDSYESGFKHVLTVVVPRKVQSAVFHPLRWGVSSTSVDPSSNAPLRLPQLIAVDKTGDIYVLNGTDLAIQTLELGHLSNITGFQFYQSAGGKDEKNYLISSDSDGKIRVSNSPNFFDVQAYCLGQEAFVSTFVVIPQSNPLILSGGLGSDLILWNALTGTKLAGFDLAPHRPNAAAATASASATPAAASVEDAVTQGCYISNISLANTQDGEFTVAVSVYPWPNVFMLSYSPSADSSSSSPFVVKSVLSTSTTPMCLTLVGDSPAAVAASAAPAAVASPARLWLIDQQLQLNIYRHGTNCGQWKPLAEGATDSAKLGQSIIESFSSAFGGARANLGETLITESNCRDFIGSGTAQPKKEAATPEQEQRAAAAAAAGNSGRYISPFSSTSHSSHLARLGLLTAAGFAFRRYYDKMQREKFVAAKRAEAQARREDSKKNKLANKAANQRQKREAGEAMEGQNEH